MRTVSATWWAAPLLAMGVALPAAASLDVSPIRIELSRPVPNALVTLTNTGKDLTRFELRVVSWSQNQAGEMGLQSTQEVFLYPPLMSIKPGEKRNARVGVAPAVFGAVEKTYRLIVEELPNPTRPGAPSQVQVVTRLSIPIFVAPEKPVGDLRLEGLTIADGAGERRRSARFFRSDRQYRGKRHRPRRPARRRRAARDRGSRRCRSTGIRRRAQPDRGTRIRLAALAGPAVELRDRRDRARPAGDRGSRAPRPPGHRPARRTASEGHRAAARHQRVLQLFRASRHQRRALRLCRG